MLSGAATQTDDWQHRLVAMLPTRILMKHLTWGQFIVAVQKHAKLLAIYTTMAPPFERAVEIVAHLVTCDEFSGILAPRFAFKSFLQLSDLCKLRGTRLAYFVQECEAYYQLSLGEAARTDPGSLSAWLDEGKPHSLTARAEEDDEERTASGGLVSTPFLELIIYREYRSYSR